MNAALLKELRQESFNKIFLYPFDKHSNRVLVVDQSGYENPRYYGKAKVGVDLPIENNLEVYKQPSQVRIPMSIEDGVRILKKLRREAIIEKARIMRWQRRSEILDSIPRDKIEKMRQY